MRPCPAEGSKEDLFQAPVGSFWKLSVVLGASRLVDAPCSLCLVFTRPSPCVAPGPDVPLHEDTSLTRWGPILPLNSRILTNYTCSDPISQGSPALRCWGVGTSKYYLGSTIQRQHSMWGRDTRFQSPWRDPIQEPRGKTSPTGALWPRGLG